MNTAEYEQAAASTAFYPDAGTGSTNAIAYVALGLTGEVGEFTNTFKKVLRGDSPLDDARDALADELGDVLWYLTRLAAELGTTLEELQSANAAKLLDRKQRDALRGDGDRR